jgi:hypothetical protein
MALGCNLGNGVEIAFKAPSLRISPLHMAAFAEAISSARDIIGTGSPALDHRHWPKKYQRIDPDGVFDTSGET